MPKRTLWPAVSRRGVLAGLASGLAAPRLHAQTRAEATLAGATLFKPFEISARRIETFSRTSSERRFGRLEFRGGLVLTSSDADFGGLSGLAIEPDGRRFVAICDVGHWVTGEIAYTASAPTGITAARIGPILGSGARELTRKRDQDAEAVALVEGNLTRGSVLIAFERNHRIGRFPVVDRVIQPPVGYLKLPAEAKAMRANKGFEAMTVLAGGPLAGSVVAISERFPDPVGNHVGWIWVQGEPKRFGFKDVGGFDVTDAASFADGSLLVLERRFRWTEGVQMQLRHLKAGDVQPGVIAQGEILLTADMTYDIDNMEGLALHRGPRGETVLTLVSDDNFNAFLQRTILLQFTLT